MPTPCQPEAFLHVGNGLFDGTSQLGASQRKFLQGWMDRYVAWVRHHAA